MPNKTDKKIELYEICTAGEFRRRVLANIPEGSQHKLQIVGQLPPDPAGWMAIDPMYFRPRSGAAAEIGAVFPALRRPAPIVMDVLVMPGNRAIVSAVEIMVRDQEPTRHRKVEATVPVDSGRMMIAGASRIEEAWKVGGPFCGANLLHHDGILKMRKKENVQEVAAAVQALRDAGFELYERYGLWHLVGPIMDADIDRAREILRQKAPKVGLNINQTETGALLDAKLEEKALAVLEDQGGLFAVAFKPGIGNGIYAWDELLAGDGVVGYRSSFLDDAEGEPEAGQ